jgi:hypothetical protein
MTDSVEYTVNELAIKHNKMMEEITAQHNAMINMELCKNIEIQQYLLILIFINFVTIVMIAIAYYPHKKIEIKPEGYKPLP